MNQKARRCPVKKWISLLTNRMLKASVVLAPLALLMTTANVNATCGYAIHQPKLPDNAKKLRKF